MEHVQEFWPQRRPMRSRPQATIARRKGIFTVLAEGTFIKLPENNVIDLYQTYIEGVLLADKKAVSKEKVNMPRSSRVGIDFSRIFKSVWENFGKFQGFHSAGEVNRLVRWALRDLKRQGRVQRTRQGRYTASAPPLDQPTGCGPPLNSPVHRFVTASHWSSQRRHLVSAVQRWDQYNQRRAQRLSRSPARLSAADAGPPRIRPRLEPPTPTLSQLYGLVPRLFPSG